MRRAVLLAAVAALMFAACGSDDGDSGGTNSTATTTKPTGTTAAGKTTGKAVTIAKKLGCTDPRSKPPGNRLGLPRPKESVACTANGVAYVVDVYANKAALQALFTAETVKTNCTLRGALGLKGPVYTVAGDDYSVTATPPPVDGKVKAGTEAQAQAAAKALGLTVKTSNCPA